MKSKSLPNLVILGPLKCDTSSLFRWLTAHPQVCGSRKKVGSFSVDTRRFEELILLSGTRPIRSNNSDSIALRGASMRRYWQRAGKTYPETTLRAFATLRSADKGRPMRSRRIGALA